MNLLGMSFCCDCDSTVTMPPKVCNYTEVKLENGIYDDLLFTKNVVQFSKIIKSEWDNSTILYAKFNGNLIAGNLQYRADTVSVIRVKRREKGEDSSWLTIKEVKVESVKDFTFTYIDRYAKAKTEYEYAVVPVVNNIEMEYTIGSVYSSFDGMIVCDKDESYQSVADTSIQPTTRRNPSQVVETLDGKYPHVIYNGNARYDSGSAQGLFVEIDWDKKVFKTETGVSYRDKVISFLTNGKPKVLKYFDGRIWLIDVTGDPTLGVQNHPDQVSISFAFTEIGSVTSSGDMYYSGLSDANVEGS